MSATDTASTWYSIVASFFGENLSDGVSSLLPAIRDHLLSITGIWFWLLLLICCCICPYWCFQKHYLPVSYGKVVGRAYFAPAYLARYIRINGSLRVNGMHTLTTE